MRHTSERDRRTRSLAFSLVRKQCCGPRRPLAKLRALLPALPQAHPKVEGQNKNNRAEESKLQPDYFYVHPPPPPLPSPSWLEGQGSQGAPERRRARRPALPQAHSKVEGANKNNRAEESNLQPDYFDLSSRLPFLARRSRRSRKSRSTRAQKS